MRIIKVILLFSTLFLVSCCGACRSGKSDSNISFTNTTWQLVQIEGKAIATTGDSYTINFSDDEGVSGKGDCNRIMGSYKASDKRKLDLSKLGSTRMMCPDQAAESKYLQTLSKVNGYVIDGNMLMLLADGEMILAFKVMEKEN